MRHRMISCAWLMERANMILVLAGNKGEFNEFLKRHTPKSIFRFVTGEDDYEGQKNCDLVLVGSYEDNPLWRKVELRGKMHDYCREHAIDIIERRN